MQSITAAAFYTFVFIMFEQLYPRRILKFWIRLLIVAVAAVGMVGIGFIDEPLLNFAYSFASIFTLNLILYKPKGKSFLIYDVILLIIMLLSDVLTGSLLSLVLDIKIDSVLQSEWYRLAGAIMYCIFLFIFFKIYIFFVPKNRIKKIKVQELIFFIVLVCGEILFLRLIDSYVVLTKGTYELTMILLSFLALDLYLAYLLNKLSQGYLLEKQYELVEQQSRLQLEAYRNLSEKYADSRKVIHDVKKHIASLEGLIQTDPQEAIKYKALMEKELNKLLPVFDFDDPILNVVLNSKRLIADKDGIKFNLDIRFSRLDFMTELDRTAIISNLLDNAFEACEELPEDKRFVTFSIIRHNDLILIYTENTFGTLKQESGKFLSTKDKHTGLGLSIVRSAAEKYNGYLSVRTENDKFVAETVIPINDPESKNDK